MDYVLLSRFKKKHPVCDGILSSHDMVPTLPARPTKEMPLRAAPFTAAKRALPAKHERYLYKFSIKHQPSSFACNIDYSVRPDTESAPFARVPNTPHQTPTACFLNYSHPPPPPPWAVKSLQLHKLCETFRLEIDRLPLTHNYPPKSKSI